jgi:hypothetical protein
MLLQLGQLPAQARLQPYLQMIFGAFVRQTVQLAQRPVRLYLRE